jgi:hypothetical protein
MARGKTPKEAFDALKLRRDEARAALEKLGTAKDGVAFGDPGLADQQSDQQARMNRFMAERNGALGKPKPKGTAPTVVTAMVRADFPLPTGSPEEFAVAARDLQDKVKAAELGGVKNTGKLTPEEQEAADEAAGNPGRGDGGPARGEPVFVFVSKVSDDDRAKATAAAFAKARRDADRLARAGGTELGGLHRLTNQSAMEDFDFRYGGGRQESYAAMTMNRNFGTADDDATEAVGFQPGKVTLRVAVVAEFTLKAPGSKPPG